MKDRFPCDDVHRPKKKNNMIKAFCIDDKRIPDAIPQSHRIKEGKWYTITFIHNIARTEEEGLTIGFELREINLNELNIPYECWKADRFGISPADLEKLHQLAMDCLEVEQVNLDELFDEQLVTLPGIGELI